MTENHSEKEIEEALTFYTDGHRCDAYDDPAAAQHFGLLLASVHRTLKDRLGRAQKVVEAARREVEKEHAGWDAGHTPPDGNCGLCGALKDFDAREARG